MARVFQISASNPHHEAVIHMMTSTVTHFVQSKGSVVVTLSEPKRTLAENKMLHALLADVARQLPWAGAKRDVETWKRLMVAAWCRARGEPVEILPALDGHGVEVVPIRTSRLNKRDCADLIEFVLAFGAEHEIRFTDSERLLP